MRNKLTIICCCLVLQLFALQVGADECPVVRIEAERLPDLNIPRVGHAAFVAGGEPTVVGGHTTSFVPTATAEYYRDGAWHVVETAYPHDQGFSVPLRSGMVLIGGGHAEPLGIGHIYSVEMYDPTTHTFKGFGCLDTKRCFVSATEIDSGRVVISGNWYQDKDDVELFDGQKYFHSVKPTSQHRARPYVLRIAEDDAIIFGQADDHAVLMDTIIVDRLRGEPLRVPLFDEWKPLPSLVEAESRDFLLTDDPQPPYIYLIPVEDKEGHIAICRIAGTEFSLLPINGSIPTTCEGRHINYSNHINIDRRAGRVYLFGWGDNDGRLYVLAINISKTPADLTLFYTEPTGHPVYENPVLTPEGDLMLMGGMEVNPDSTVDNFTPHATVLLLPVGRDLLTSSEGRAVAHVWLWVLLACVGMGLSVILWRRKQAAPAETSKNADSTDVTNSDEALMERICQLMDEEKPYLNSDLKIADIAGLLGTNVSYVSACINRHKGCSFIQFVNGYRISYAKTLLRCSRDKKISEVWVASGFANETSFFRTFKALTGMTPTEWKTKID